MSSARLFCFLAAGVVACGPNDRVEQTATAVPTLGTSWLMDGAAGQLPDSQPSFFPECDGQPSIGSAGIGPARVDRPLAELLRTCPRVYRYWDLTDDAAPQPAVAFRVGGALLKVLLEDTLGTSRVERVLTDSRTAKTAGGVGPGSTLADLERGDGRATIAVSECTVSATGRTSRVGWVLALPQGWDCDRIDSLGIGGSRPPADARVAIAIVSGQTARARGVSSIESMPPYYVGQPLYTEPNACAGEGCTAIDSSYVAKDTVVLFARPDTADPVLARVAPGEPLRLIGTQVQSRPAPLLVRRGHAGLAPGDTLWLLNYLGEGHFIVSFRGQMTEMDLGMSPWGEQEYPVCAQPDCWAHLPVRFYVTTWWRLQKGEVAGWARLPISVEIAPRN